MDKFPNYPISSKVESFLAKPNDVYNIRFDSVSNSRSIEVTISVPIFSIITIDKSYGSFSINPVNEYFDIDNVCKTNG